MSISCGFIILKAHYRVGMLIKNMIGEDIIIKQRPIVKRLTGYRPLHLRLPWGNHCLLHRIHPEYLPL